jgi:peptidoglycan hydrolase-like protein with peptidoglycan-binding domain
MRIPTNSQSTQQMVQEIPQTKERVVEETQAQAATEVHQDTIKNESRSTRMQSELALSGQLQRSNLQSQVGVLGPGSSGPQVSDLQDDLNKIRAQQGKPPIAADGIFGPKTEAAVKEFQREQGIKPDGLVGPQTKAALALEILKADPQTDPVTLQELVNDFQDVIKATDTETRVLADQLLRRILDTKLQNQTRKQDLLIDPDPTDDLAEE